MQYNKLRKKDKSPSHSILICLFFFWQVFFSCICSSKIMIIIEFFVFFIIFCLSTIIASNFIIFVKTSQFGRLWHLKKKEFISSKHFEIKRGRTLFIYIYMFMILINDFVCVFDVSNIHEKQVNLQRQQYIKRAQMVTIQD